MGTFHPNPPPQRRASGSEIPNFAKARNTPSLLPLDCRIMFMNITLLEIEVLLKVSRVECLQIGAIHYGERVG